MKKKQLLVITIFGVLATTLLGWTLYSLGQNSSMGLRWNLVVDGLVEHPLNLTFEELWQVPRSTVNAELICVDGPVGLVAEGNWTGVKLNFLLERAGVRPESIKVAFYADDGYTTDLTVTTAMRDDIIIAYGLDGEGLEERLRLVVPGKWGYKWISRLTRIELVDYDFKGHWESAGYSDEAEIP